MAETTAPVALTLEQKKAAARERARAARAAQDAGRDAGLLEVTDAAADYIREAATRTGTQPGVRLRILAGGCSGLEYKLDLLGADETARPLDRGGATNGVRVLMDPKSAIPVTGSGVDYESGPLRPGVWATHPPPP